MHLKTEELLHQFSLILYFHDSSRGLEDTSKVLWEDKRLSMMNSLSNKKFYQSKDHFRAFTKCSSVDNTFHRSTLLVCTCCEDEKYQIPTRRKLSFLGSHNDPTCPLNCFQKLKLSK